MYGTGSEELAAASAELVSYGARLCIDGMAVGSAGNLSVRVGGTVAITPSGIPCLELRSADICLVTPGGDQFPQDGTDQMETRCWISSAMHSRPWPPGSPQRRPPPAR